MAQRCAPPQSCLLMTQFTPWATALIPRTRAILMTQFTPRATALVARAVLCTQVKRANPVARTWLRSFSLITSCLDQLIRQPHRLGETSTSYARFGVYRLFQIPSQPPH